MKFKDLKEKDWFQELFSPNGRRGRAEFIALVFFLCCLSTGVEHTPLLKKLIVPDILFMYIAFTNIVKRLHDLNHSGYWAGVVYACFFSLAGIGLMMEMDNPPDIYLPRVVGLIMFGIVALGFTVGLLLLIFKRGTVGENKYGYDPVK